PPRCKVNLKRWSERSRSEPAGDVMRRPSPVAFLALGVVVGTACGYWYARLPASTSDPTITASSVASAAERKILYYRDPSGAPYWSAGPKKDANGRDYLPVYEDEEISFDPRSN